MRAAIDTLFRTAVAHGLAARAIGVLLSGFLDDGSAGLRAIRMRGGVTIVQDPGDAEAPDMPASALRLDAADYILPASEIGPRLVRLTQTARKGVAMKEPEVRGRGDTSPDNGDEKNSHLMAAYPGEGNGTPSTFACPECHGVLWEITEGGSVRYRCRVGHGYSEKTLDEELSRAAESALWAAMRALDEKAAMARRMADAATGSPEHWANRLRDQAQSSAAHAEMLRKMILGRPAVPESDVPESVEKDQASKIP